MPSKRRSECEDKNETSDIEPKRRKIKRVSIIHLEESLGIKSPTLTVEPCGVIVRIILKNIFCHEHLDFDGFTPYINLLQGANGSGKSSIVAAIIVGLGGSSKATDRGRNLRSLIQYGKQWASIEIHLKNKGHLAFKPDVYGEKVIVERKLLESGTSSYKIKAENGHIISTKKEDLSRILDWYNFQVDNPVLVLSQERAKTFLCSTDPKDLFEFFMTATQIRQWNDTFMSTKRDLGVSSTLVKQKVERLPVLEKEVKDWEKKIQAINSLEDNRKRLAYLRKAKAWAEVKEDEEEANEMKLRKEKSENCVMKLKHATKEAEAKIKKLAETSSSYGSELVQLTEKSEHWEAERSKANKELVEMKRRLREKQNKKTNFEEESFERERDVAILKEKLEDNNAAKTIWETTVAELNTEKKKLKKEIDKLEKCLKTEETRIQNLTQSLQESEDEYKHYMLQEKDTNNILGLLHTELRNVKGEKDNLTVFGQFMPRVIKEIHATHAKRLFKNKPIGPIGSYIKVKNKDWVHIVENVTKDLLTSFLVSCPRDYDRLTQIFTRTIPKGTMRPQVIVSAFRNKVHNVGRFETKSDLYSSMWSIIQTGSIHVANTLLDQLQVESLLLVPTAAEANDLLIEENLVPKNCKKAMTLNGDTYFPDPNFKVYSGNGDRRVHYLQVSVEDKIRDLKMNIRSTTTKVSKLREETLEKKKRFDTLNEEKGKSLVKQNRYDKELNVCKRQLQELKNREIPPPPDFYQLQNDLKENEALKSAVEEKVKAVEETIEEGQREVAKAEERLKKAQKESKNIKITLNKHEVSTSQTQKELVQKKKELLAYAKKEEEIERVHEELSESLTEKEERINVKIEEIMKIMGKDERRIEPKKSKKKLERDFLALQNLIRKEESNYGNLEVITAAWRIKMQKYEKIKSEIKSQQAFILKMSESLDSRSTLLNATKKLLSLFLRTTFKTKIREKNLMGHVDIDYEAKTLKILMASVTNDKTRQLQSLKMMSGGEKSFATVSFLLTLWDVVSSPIRIMDEFDVGMDPQLREQCLEMIIKARKQNVQYLMVSPQECRIKAEKVHVFRMPSPQRTKKEVKSEEF